MPNSSTSTHRAYNPKMRENRLIVKYLIIEKIFARGPDIFFLNVKRLFMKNTKNTASINPVADATRYSIFRKNSRMKKII